MQHLVTHLAARPEVAVLPSDTDVQDYTFLGINTKDICHFPNMARIVCDANI